MLALFARSFRRSVAVRSLFVRGLVLTGAAGLLLASLHPSTAAGQPAESSSDRYQKVTYEMDVHLKADRHRMIGHQTVTYENLSPDTLRKVYFHLYFNAFEPNSMMAERSRWVPDPDPRIVPRIFRLDPEERGYHRIHSLTQEEAPLDYRIFETVLEAELAEPLPPGSSTEFDVRFRSQVPLQTRRSGRDNDENVDFSMSQWYPKVAKYDASGWHPDPYVEREFYAPFASFDVRLRLPSNYVVGSTGRLVNPEEVGHGYADTSRTGPTGETDSLTWHFRANRVHDFAWAADPDYLHDTVIGPNGTRIHLLYQPEVASRWRPMRSWVPAILSFFGREYGRYPYRQFTVAQAGDGGMEYPQIVFLTGRRSPSSLLGVTAHEMGHQWFYALMASNESDYAWMDEGFTSYADTEASHYVRTRSIGASSASAPDTEASHLGAYLNWLYVQQTGLTERLNTPADWFLTNFAYDYASYVGGEMLVDMLGGVISDSLRDRWLEEYYRRYRFDHPDPGDVERLAEEVSGMRLDWYFDQWTNTTRSLDYELADWTVRPAGDGYRAEIVIERIDPMVMPVDVRVDLADGPPQWIHVPRGVSFGHKPVPDSWRVADPWPWTSPTDTLVLETDRRPVRAEIDPDGTMPDRNRLNNTTGFPVESTFLRPPSLGWFHYSLGWRPALHYADRFGPGVGLQIRGSYLFDRYDLTGKLRIWPRVLFSGGEEPSLRAPSPGTDGAADVSALDGINYDLTYRTPFPAIGRPSSIGLRARDHLGILENRLTLSRELAPHAPLTSRTRRARISLIHQHRYSERAYGSEDALPTWNARHLTSVAGWFLRTEPGVRLRLFGEVGAELGSSFLNAPRPSIRLRADGETYLDRDPWRLGIAGSIGWGGPGLVVQRRYRLGSVPLEERWRSDAFRPVSALFADPRRDLHLGALGHAGPVGYLRSPGTPGGTPRGRHLAAATAYADLRPSSSHRLVDPLRVRAYLATGTVWNRTSESPGAFLEERVDELLSEAGLGVSYRISEVSGLDRWSEQSSLLPGLNLSVRLPVWLSDPDRVDPGSAPIRLANRWVLGIDVNWPLR